MYVYAEAIRIYEMIKRVKQRETKSVKGCLKQ